jgi:sarcosine oxidase subunit beta
MKRLKTDVVIIGAGIIGSSIAYHLARKKVRVVVVEKGDIADGSSGACDGLVFLQSKKPGTHLQLAMESSRRFGLLARQLPVPIEYKKTGGMVVIETEDEWSAMAQFVDAQQEIGLDVSLLTKAEARRLEPHLAEHLSGATHSPLDGQVNPISLTLGFALGARDLGTRIFTGTAACGIETTAGRVSAVETSTGRIETDIVVNAAGAHAAEIGALVGLDIPIKPRRGQIIVTEPCSPMIGNCMISAKYIAAKFNPDIARKSGEGISIEQTENGNFLLGSTREFVGFNRRTTTAGLHRIAKKTAGIIPMLKQVHIIRAFAGLRPYTPDGLPILGPVAAVPGFFMAAGHEGDGIALSPITGELIAQMIVAGKTDIALDDFRLDRFSGGESDTEVSRV